MKKNIYNIFLIQMNKTLNRRKKSKHKKSSRRSMNKNSKYQGVKPSEDDIKMPDGTNLDDVDDVKSPASDVTLSGPVNFSILDGQEPAQHRIRGFLTQSELKQLIRVNQYHRGWHPENYLYIKYSYLIMKVNNGKITMEQYNAHKRIFMDIDEELTIPLPSNLTRLKIGNDFNRLLGVLPQRLTHLTLGSDFNHPLGVLPPTLTHLTLGNEFNQTLGELPKGLTHLTLGYEFNHDLGVLPQGLTHLTLGVEFIHQLEELPPNLTHLTLGRNYNSPLEGEEL